MKETTHRDFSGYFFIRPPHFFFSQSHCIPWNTDINCHLAVKILGDQMLFVAGFVGVVFGDYVRLRLLLGMRACWLACRVCCSILLPSFNLFLLWLWTWTYFYCCCSCWMLEAVVVHIGISSFTCQLLGKEFQCKFISGPSKSQRSTGFFTFGLFASRVLGFALRYV